jgi:hypothetical protein
LTIGFFNSWSNIRFYSMPKEGQASPQLNGPIEEQQGAARPEQSGSHRAFSLEFPGGFRTPPTGDEGLAPVSGRLIIPG